MAEMGGRRKVVHCWTVVVLLFSDVLVCSAWLSLYNNIMLSGAKTTTSGFVDSVQIGAETGLRECEYQFRWERWNCPQMAIKKLVMEQSKSADNREMAFVHGIGSAGITYTLTKQCSDGSIHGCQCDLRRRKYRAKQEFEWGGCSDNAHFGERVARKLIDAVESGDELSTAISIHNNEAGRKAIRKTMRLVCKCHGVSGSCAVKTCWQKLAEFRKVGDYLKRKYMNAKRAELKDGRLVARQKAGKKSDGSQKSNRRGRNGTNRRKSDSFPINQQYSNFRPENSRIVLKSGDGGGRNRNKRNRFPTDIPKFDLVYMQESPDYCTVNMSAGLMGTVGRDCIRSENGRKLGKWEERSCDRLCTACGLKVRRYFVREEKMCDCKFEWCCEIRCQKCVVDSTKYTCSVPR